MRLISPHPSALILPNETLHIYLCALSEASDSSQPQCWPQKGPLLIKWSSNGG